MEYSSSRVGKPYSMTRPPEISVVIPTHNKAENLAPLLKAVCSQSMDPARFEVVVVDDCSDDGTWETLQRLASDVPVAITLLRTQQNSGGPAAPRNLGWRSASAPVIAFLDDDCLPEPGWLDGALSSMADDPRIGVAEGRTLAPPGTDLTQLGRWYVWRIVEEPGPWFVGTNIIFRTEALEQVGGFDERMKWWGEDTDLGWKVVEAGWGRGFASEAVAIHDVEQRGWWWFVRFGWRERNLVRCAAEHPQFRREGFWRPWAYRREDAAFVLALLGSIAAKRWRPAAILALPYLWWQRPSIRQPGFVKTGLQIVAVDAARCAGQLSGAVSNRVFVI
jgi:GT2 family glycosyltransferase